MNVSLIGLSIIFICPLIVLAISKENEITMVADVLQSFGKPSHVIAKLCWKSSIKKELMRRLATADAPKSIKFVGRIDAKELVNKETIIILVDLSCPGVTEVFKIANSSSKFAKPYRWLVIGKQVEETGDVTKVPSELNNLSILPDSEVYVSQYIRNDSCVVNLIYKIKPQLGWIIENYGVWTNNLSFNKSRHIIEVTMPMRRKNLARETIVTTMVINDNSTLADLEYLRYPQVDSISKSSYRQLTTLYQFINATRELVFTDNWGYNINGSWTGMLRHIVEEKAELTGSVMFITKERVAILDYLSYPTAAGVKFIFREPPLSYQNNLYLLPFRATVWYCIGTFVIIIILLVYVNAYWEERKTGNQEEHDSSVLVPNISDATVFVMGAISQQGNDVELKGTLGRFVTLILLLVFLFLYTAYSASIVVLLQSSSDQIRTLSDLLQSKLELGVEDTPYSRYLFAIEKEPIRRAIYEKKVAPSGSKPKFYDLVEGVRHLQKKPFAFHCNLGAAYKIMEKYFYEHEKCGLQEIAFLQESVPWLGCRKGSPYQEIFKIGQLRNAESGLNDRINQLMFSKKPVCSARGGSFVSVSLVDCYPSLLLLLYGMILAVLLLFAELLFTALLIGACDNLSTAQPAVADNACICICSQTDFKRTLFTVGAAHATTKESVRFVNARIVTSSDNKAY